MVYMFSLYLTEEKVYHIPSDAHGAEQPYDGAFRNSLHKDIDPMKGPRNSAFKELIVWLKIDNENPIWWVLPKREAKGAEGAWRGGTQPWMGDGGAFQRVVIRS